MKVEKSLDNANACKCLTCPSYASVCKLKNKDEINFHTLDKLNNSHMELLFCAFEKSNCIHENRGCVCATCSVHKKYKLNNEDYCLYTGGVL